MNCPEGPSESEQRAPMAMQANVTIRAAERRGRRNSSWKKAVLTSCREMSEVRAAIDSRA